MQRNVPHGISPHYRAPYSGQLSVGQIEASLATLPGSVAKLKEVWESIGESRVSGLSPIFQGGPLDDAVRAGEWVPELQQSMPTMGGYPGSRGAIQMWPYDFCEDVGFDSVLKNNFLNGGAEHFSEGHGNTFSEGHDDAVRAKFPQQLISR